MVAEQLAQPLSHVSTTRTGLSARYPTSLRTLQWVNGRPSFSGGCWPP